jgi:hypothetical protein
MIAFFSRLLCWLLFCASVFAANALRSVTWGYDAQVQVSRQAQGGLMRAMNLKPGDQYRVVIVP